MSKGVPSSMPRSPNRGVQPRAREVRAARSELALYRAEDGARAQASHGVPRDGGRDFVHELHDRRAPLEVHEVVFVVS